MIDPDFLKEQCCIWSSIKNTKPYLWYNGKSRPSSQRDLDDIEQTLKVYPDFKYTPFSKTPSYIINLIDKDQLELSKLI